VQGRLRGDEVTASVETECAHCGEPLHLEIDSALEFRVLTEHAAPLVCTPFVDVSRLGPSIIDGF
jgi:hypothetical protein